MPNIYLALLHYPVYNKRGDIVSTCITGFDLHDIARTAETFGIKKYYVVNPLASQREFAEKIIACWMDEKSLEFNWTRAQAFKLINIAHDLEEVIAGIVKEEGNRPRIIATSAKDKMTISFRALRQEMQQADEPYLLTLGTGWGMTEDFFGLVDAVLPPIKGVGQYNHLPVRSANAIILDRLLGREE